MSASLFPTHKFAGFIAIAMILSLATFAACNQSNSRKESGVVPPHAIEAKSLKELRSIFKRHNYSWDNLQDGVPPLMLNRFPSDLRRLQPAERKKRLFFLALLPMALLANEEISNQRRALQTVFDEYDTTGVLRESSLSQLNNIQGHYRVKGNPLTSKAVRSKLLRRVDTIPPAMLLAQAANESGWGTSRFARIGNNLFGEWTFTPGQGLIPENRPAGATYEVRRFDSLYQSIRSYVLNINTHWAYNALRQRREQMRRNGELITGLKLADELDLYSARRDSYSRDIINLIRREQLEQLATVRLRSTPTQATFTEPDTPDENCGLHNSSEMLRKEQAQLLAAAGRNQG